MHGNEHYFQLKKAPMDKIKIILIGLIGLIIGSVLGFLTPLFICLIHDLIMKPTPGSGLMTVGWVFCFITIPVGAIAGSFLAIKISRTKASNTDVK